MIYASVVCRNEQGRYLVDVLCYLEELCDGIAIYDDQSTDDTVMLARSFGRCRVRPDHVPGFTQNEALFRQHAWWWLKEAYEPTDQDWVLSIDADEFLVSPHDTRHALDQFILQHPNECGVFDVPEVFGWDDEGRPQIRVDGFWGKINAARFCRWNYHSFNIGQTLGGGSLPPAACTPASVVQNVQLMHFGYAREQDRQARAERYGQHAGAHSNKHIQSITQPPTLATWHGPVPRIGAR